MIKAIYPGSFDPVTYGHLDVIKRASKVVDELIIGVLVNQEKTPLFTREERVELLKQTTKEFPNVRVLTFTGLTIDFAKQNDAKLIIRVPLIPGYTDSQDDIRQIGLFLRDELQLKIERCELLPYNKLAASKYGNKTGWSDYTIGTYRLPELEPQSKDELAALCNLLSSFGVNAYAESL